MPARLIIIYYFGVPARFIYKRWQQYLLDKESSLEHMRQIAILTLLIITFHSYGQTRTITGKVLFDDLSPVIDARILNNERRELGTTNANGDFTIQTLSGTSELLFG